MNKKYIWVTFNREGFHCYPEALDNPSLRSVSFLGHQHRHIFYFKVFLEVNHNNRDLEFIQVKRWMESLYGEKLELSNKSCEMIAEELHKKLVEKYGGNRSIIIEVSEDNENGCRIEFERTTQVK